MRRLAWLVGLAMAAVAGLAVARASTSAIAAQEPQTRPTFRATTDVVAVDVSVRDGRRAITGLTAPDFRLTDNGVPQTITDVSYGRLPIDVSVVLDVSDSVTGPLLDQLRTAIRQLMSDMGADDRLRLIHFNMRVARVVDLTNDASAVDRAITQVRAGGGSSIYDAAAVALVSASAAPADRRQLIVLFSDGNDSTSFSTPRSLLQVAQRTNASMTFVLPDTLVTFTTRIAVSSQAMRLAPYERVARETGGAIYRSSQNLTPTFRRALEEFRSSYVLHFTPQGVERSGDHVLDVTVPRDDGYTIRARRGYFGG
jgi:VWFA-related protein